MLSGPLLLLDVSGVGYEVQTTRACAEQAVLGETLRVIIYTDVREDSIQLFGFADHLEKQVFLLLKMVKGIGAKSAQQLVSQIDKIQLLRLIADGDTASLQKVKGVGKKTAGRIVVELRDKVGEYVVQSVQPNSLARSVEVSDSATEALLALQALGFVEREAERLVQAVRVDADLTQLESSEVVRLALRML